jgi:hypothetical protein
MGGIYTHLETFIRTNVHLDIDESAIILEPFVGVARITVLVVETVRSSTIGEKNHHLMNRLRVLGEIILERAKARGKNQHHHNMVKVQSTAHPERIGILQVSLGVPLLGVDEVRELCGVPDEEDRSVVEHPVPVTFIRP